MPNSSAIRAQERSQGRLPAGAVRSGAVPGPAARGRGPLRSGPRAGCARARSAQERSPGRLRAYDRSGRASAGTTLPGMLGEPIPLRTVAATRYVTPFREGGSLPGLCEADDDGLYVVKFHGAGQGPRALVAEIIAGELGRALGLPVPEQVLVELDPALGAGEPLIEVRELLERSPGTNVGIDFLPGALAFAPAIGPRPGPEEAAAIAWFDALVINPDRTARNANLLTWHGRTYCIDHGAALYIHHRWARPLEHARGAFPQIAQHVLLPIASSITDADALLAPLVTRDLLAAIVAAVPDAWLAAGHAFPSVAENREAYVAYLLARLAPPRAFVEEAERARTGA